MSSTTYFEGAGSIACTKIGAIRHGQDGAMFGGYIFRFDVDGMCYVFDAENFAPQSSFALDRRDVLCPHSNAVCFGVDYAVEGDEFPLLYTNMYNNAAKQADRREATVCVYRITREGMAFTSQMVQCITVGFAKTELWMSEGKDDIRPYGNFVIDAARRELIAFTMRDEEHTTRFFRFALPNGNAGEMDDTLGVKKAVLTENDVIAHFDTAYMHFMQGAICHNGYVYSSEGFEEEANPARLRIIDLARGKEVLNVNLREMGLYREAELVEVYEGKTYYADNVGEVYAVTFI